jgi:hypothetical protein
MDAPDVAPVTELPVVANEDDNDNQRNVTKPDYLEKEVNLKKLMKKIYAEAVLAKERAEAAQTELPIVSESSQITNKSDAGWASGYYYDTYLRNRITNTPTICRIPWQYRSSEIDAMVVTTPVRDALKELRRFYLEDLSELRRKHRAIMKRVEDAVSDAVAVRDSQLVEQGLGSVVEKWDALVAREVEHNRAQKEKKDALETEMRKLVHRATLETHERFAKQRKLE